MSNDGFILEYMDLSHIHLAVLDGPKMVGFCDLLGTPCAQVSKIPSVNENKKIT